MTPEWIAYDLDDRDNHHHADTEAEADDKAEEMDEMAGSSGNWGVCHADIFDSCDCEGA